MLDGPKESKMRRLFFVTTNDETMDAAIRGAIEEHFPAENYPLGRGQWIVAAEGTSKELSDKLGVTTTEANPNPLISNTIVLGIAGYYGRHSRDMWEWMASRLEKPVSA
jgi:hypothetical protein